MEIINKESKEEIDEAVVKIISNSIRELLNSQEHVVLGIPGGRSVPGIFQLLKESFLKLRKNRLPEKIFGVL